MKHTLQLPLTKAQIASLRAGDMVFLNGIIYTARDAAHKRLIEMIEKKQELPFNIQNAAIYYVGPSPSFGKHILGSAGPTTSSRCDKYTPLLLQSGITVMIGKGKRNNEVKQAIQEYGAVYLAATGGAGALLSSCIRSSEVIAFDDLGTEAIRKIYVENFPAIVINDCHGDDYYDTSRRNYLNFINT